MYARRSMVRGQPRSVVLVALALAGCTLLRSTPDVVPPEAPSARVLFGLSPRLLDRALPAASARFRVREDFLDRLVCAGSDLPAWKRTNIVGPVETYEMSCVGLPAATLTVDTSESRPDAPAGFRLLGDGFDEWRRAYGFAEKQDFAAALAELEKALVAEPGEPVYRRDRVYFLYSLGRAAEAMVEADSLLPVARSPVLLKYRALAARDLGLTTEVLQSIEGIIGATVEGETLHAEAVCAKGLILTGEGDAEAPSWVEKGCTLAYKPCCDAIAARKALDIQSAQALEAARALPITLPSGPEVAPLPATPAVPDAPQPEEKKGEAVQAP